LKATDPHENRRRMAAASITSFVTTLAAVLFVALASASCATTLQWQPYSVDIDALAVADWIADIGYLRAELPKRNPHFRDDPAMAAAFDRRAESLLASLASSDQGQLALEPGPLLADRAIAGMAELLALVGEGHTALNAYPTSRFPCYLRWFFQGDGYEARLLAIDPSRATIEAVDGFVPPSSPIAAFGATLVGVVVPAGSWLATAGSVIADNGGAGLDAVPGSLECILDASIAAESDIPADARALAYRHSRGSRLNDPRLMSGLGLAGIDQDGNRYIRYRMRSADGSAFDLAVRETPDGTGSITLARGDTRPVSSSGSDPWWSVRMDATGTARPDGPVMFVSYSSCDTEAMPFLRNVVAELESGGVQRLVIDVRNNGGGNSMPGTWFASRLADINTFKEPGRIHVLVGPGSFSSALWLSVDLMDKTPALFAGLPIAESPDSYGEVGRFALPASGIVIGHSTRLHRYSAGKSLRLRDGIIVPDQGLELHPTYDDWLSARDGLLELVLGNEP